MAYEEATGGVDFGNALNDRGTSIPFIFVSNNSLGLPYESEANFVSIAFVERLGIGNGSGG